MRVFTFVEIEIDGAGVPQGNFIEIHEAALPGLSGKVAYIKDGVLRVPRHVESLEALIVGLTADDLVLQKQQLLKHCQAFGGRNIGNRWKEWEKRAEALMDNGGISREEAETEAARKLNLLAFLNDRPKS